MSKRILFIATGGTIASKKTKKGLTPQISPQELLGYVPEAGEMAEIEVAAPFNLDSSNVTPEHWQQLVKLIRDNYESYDGFVIAHGTDTMAYTAAALSYMIQNSEKPIVLTGAQRPINLEITDAKTNLRDSFLYAVDDESSDVVIVFDGKVIAGTRAKKVRTKSYNAFSSIDFPQLAVIQDGRILRYIRQEKAGKKVHFYEKLDDGVFVLKLLPGIRPTLLRTVFENYDAVIVESFGVGGIPLSIRREFAELCREYPEKLILMSTQVAHEGSDMTVYEVGQEMKELCNFLESYDMTPEAVAAKTMWLLANVPADPESRRRYFYHKINYDTIWPDCGEDI